MTPASSPAARQKSDSRKASPSRAGAATSEKAPGERPGVPDETPAAGSGIAAPSPSQMPVREGEDPWTDDEVSEVVAMLNDDMRRFSEQIEVSTRELEGMLRDGTEGAGRDPADVGSANFERDAEMSLANNAKEMLDQARLAMRHLELGTYGRCDNCDQPIGKGRLQAFPRATLCVQCKQREERR